MSWEGLRVWARVGNIRNYLALCATLLIEYITACLVSALYVISAMYAQGRDMNQPYSYMGELPGPGVFVGNVNTGRLELVLDMQHGVHPVVLYAAVTNGIDCMFCYWVDGGFASMA